jgi:alkylated DNA repair protein (DNA oxidative demethylase)
VTENNEGVPARQFVVSAGLVYRPGYLDRDAQIAVLKSVRDVLQAAPLFTPTMPKSGKPFSVKMSNCGPLGWVSDADKGYRYQAYHPITGRPWPPIPAALLQAWRDLGAYPHLPEACLINVYDGRARMGLHQDKDEQELTAPVVSISLGDTCLFRIGGVVRHGSTRSFRLNSGDGLALSGASRLAFHGVDRILSGSSTLLPEGGRINLTLRRVSPPP